MINIKITARELIRRSLILVGALGQGENPTSHEADDALKTLNEIVDKWNVESLMICSNKTISFNPTGKVVYTMGETGDIPVRPVTGILNAYYKDIDGKNTYGINIITNYQYGSINDKTQTGTPYELYYSASFPVAELYLYPVPIGGEVFLSISDKFNLFDTLDDVIELPSGYIKALRYNLAVELSIEYGRQIDEKVEKLALNAKAFIKSINGSQKRVLATVDRALMNGGSFNINIGE